MNRKNRFYVNVENKKFYFFFILRNMQKKCNHQRGGRFLGFIGLWIALTGNEFIELSSPLRGAPSKRRSLRCSIYLSASYGMISIMKSATSGVFFPPLGALQHQKSVQANWIHIGKQSVSIIAERSSFVTTFSGTYLPVPRIPARLTLSIMFPPPFCKLESFAFVDILFF